jgi:competence protein ComEC
MVIAWCGGIALSAAHAQAAALHSALPTVAVLGGAALALINSPKRSLRRLCLCLAVGGLGMAHHSAAVQPFSPAQLPFYNDRGTVILEGVISAPPERRENAARLIVSAHSLTQRGERHSISGTALVYAERYGDYRYGDLIRVRGAPQTPPTFDAFSFQDYLARQGVYSVVLRATVSVLERDQGNPLLAALYSVRESAHELLRRLLPDPQAALLAGILLGDEHNLTAGLADAFRRTNTSHLIAISGANIAVIVALLMAACRLLPRRLAGKLGVLFVTVSGVGLYTLFVGAEASVVRAAIMTTFVLLAERLGRRNDGLTALAASVFLMTLLNPSALFDVGLILSAAATVGLIVYLPPLTQLSERLIGGKKAHPTAHVLAEWLWITSAAQLTTLPIIVLISGQVAPLGVLINVLVAPAQALIMLIGLATLAFGALWLPLGQVAAWLVGLPLSYTLGVIRGAADVPHLSAPLPITPLAAALYYAALFGGTAFAMQHPAVRRMVWQWARQAGRSAVLLLFGCGVAILLWLLAAARSDGKLHVWWLEVGEGSAVLIQTPHGAHILIDGGENPIQLQQALGDVLPFYKRHLDMVILSAPHEKLVGALPALLARYSVGMVLHNGQRTGSPTFAALEAAIRAADIPTQGIGAGWRLQTPDGVLISALAPHSLPESATRPDSAPLLLRMEYGTARLLLLAEAAPEAIGVLLQTAGDLRAQVVQLPANGAANSNPPRWLEQVQPQIAVVVAEVGNANAQPAEVLIERLGVPLFRTDQHGRLHLITDGERLEVRTGRQRP